MPQYGNGTAFKDLSAGAGDTATITRKPKTGIFHAADSGKKPGSPTFIPIYGHKGPENVPQPDE